MIYSEGKAISGTCIDVTIPAPERTRKRRQGSVHRNSGFMKVFFLFFFFFFLFFVKGALFRGKEGPPVLEKPARHLPPQGRGFVRPPVCPTPPTIRRASGGQLTDCWHQMSSYLCSIYSISLLLYWVSYVISEWISGCCMNLIYLCQYNC